LRWESVNVVFPVKVHMLCLYCIDMCAKNCQCYTLTGNNIGYFDLISYWVCTALSLFCQCLLCLTLPKTQGTRRLYMSSRCIKQRFLWTENGEIYKVKSA
jgi:hypothetical protein